MEAGQTDFQISTEKQRLDFHDTKQKLTTGTRSFLIERNSFIGPLGVESEALKA